LILLLCDQLGAGRNVRAGARPCAEIQHRDNEQFGNKPVSSWAFGIDIKTCRECGGTVKVTACIEDPVVIEKILTHLQGNDASVSRNLLPASRAPPADLFG
jgi:hypothetical protein